MTTLLIDGDNLCHRSFHALPPMTHEGRRTEAVFGALRQAKALRMMFKPKVMAWCFDSSRSLRKELSPGYKSNREHRPAYKPNKERKHLTPQIQWLYELLPEAGFGNVMRHDGYEGDDLLAACCPLVSGEKVIVTTDQDMLQLLSAKQQILCYDPMQDRLMTELKFKAAHGIPPSRWADVKSIAGCKSDCIPGVQGVGVKTSVKYITGEMAPGSRVWNQIEANRGMIEANMRLVKLPFGGLVMEGGLAEDSVTPESWGAALDSIGAAKMRV